MQAGDLLTMIELLNLHLKLGIPKGIDHLTVDQVIQYALLNELLQEAENNYRAIDMRMQMALTAPVMEMLWNPSQKPKDVAGVFSCTSQLFVKNK